MDVLVGFLKKYWLIMLLVLFLIVGVVMVFSLGGDLGKWRNAHSLATEELAALELELEGLSIDFDEELEKNTIRETSVSAKDAGSKMVSVDTTLASFYRNPMPFPEGSDQATRDALEKTAEDARVEYRALTGLSTEGYVNTWQLNPEWELKLETVLNYKNVKSFPVVFSMKTKAGENAGLIYTTYVVEDERFVDTVRHYTQAGMDDQIDPGGM